MNAEVKDLTRMAKKTEQKIGRIYAADPAPETDSEAVAYIGPSLKRVIQSGAVFKNGYPIKVQNCLSRFPFLTGLFVPISNLAEAKKEVKTVGTGLNVLYGEIEKIGGKVDV